MSIQTVEGVVQKVIKGAKAYSALINEAWYGCGFDKPSFEEGHTIKAAFTENGKWKNMDMASVRAVNTITLDKPAPTVTKAPAKKEAPVSGGNKDNYWENKAAQDHKTQKEIRLQASRNTAVSLVSVLLERELVSIPTKKADQAGFVEELVNYYTNLFYNQTMECNNPEYDKGRPHPDSVVVVKKSPKAVSQEAETPDYE